MKKVTLILCDFAQAAEGKLYISGGGWTIKGLMTPMGVGIVIEIPWNESHDRHHFLLELVTEDGEPVSAPGAVGATPVRIEGDFDLGRPPGYPHGSPLTVPLAANVSAFPLEPGQRYVWRFTLDEETREEWNLGFTVAVLPPGMQVPPGMLPN